MKFFSMILIFLIATNAGCGKTETETTDKLKGQSENYDEKVAARNEGNLSSRSALPASSKLKAPTISTENRSTINPSDSYSPAEIKSPDIIKKRLIIKNGQLTIEVAQYDQARVRLTKIADSLGGYISDSQMNIHYTGVSEGLIVIRIPAGKFETAVELIKNSATKIEKENIKASDITEEFYDLEARLSNKKKAEQRMQEILRSAKTINEILSVEQTLTAIREDIERFEGRLRLLSDQVALSTINIILHERYPVEISRSGGFWATIAEGFVDGFRGFAVVLSRTITFLIAGIPVFAAIYLIVFLILHIVKRNKKKKIQVISQTSPTSAP